MKSRAAVLDKLRKLLALATSPNKHEADVAGRTADRLMKKHGLTKDDVAAAEDECHELPLGAKGWQSPWRFALVTAAARFCNADAVALVAWRRRKVRLVGRKADVLRARDLYESLAKAVREVERLAVDKIEDLLADAVGWYGVRDTAEAFRLGVVQGIAQKLDGAKRSAASGEKAVAIAIDRAEPARRKYAPGRMDNPFEHVEPRDMFDLGCDLARACLRVQASGEVEVVHGPIKEDF